MGMFDGVEGGEELFDGEEFSIIGIGRNIEDAFAESFSSALRYDDRQYLDHLRREDVNE